MCWYDFVCVCVYFFLLDSAILRHVSSVGFYPLPLLSPVPTPCVAS